MSRQVFMHTSPRNNSLIEISVFFFSYRYILQNTSTLCCCIPYEIPRPFYTLRIHIQLCHETIFHCQQLLYSLPHEIQTQVSRIATYFPNQPIHLTTFQTNAWSIHWHLQNRIYPRSLLALFLALQLQVHLCGNFVVIFDLAGGSRYPPSIVHAPTYRGSRDDHDALLGCAGHVPGSLPPQLDIQACHLPPGICVNTFP